MNYPEALRYLFSFINYERMVFRYGARALNLKRMALLLDWFGHPEEQFRAILVAGTKGKGSTAYFLASLLSAHGYPTGLYTSPHLSDPRERIKLDGKAISPRDLAQWSTEIRRVLGRRKKEMGRFGEPTFFELFTLMAILHFASEGAWFGIFEIGMGGRLDATNILRPLLSVITPISLDHEEYLGKTLARIAHEKAAIIKPRGFVVVSNELAQARRVIRAWARKQKAEPFFLGRSFHILRAQSDSRRSRFDFRMFSRTWRDLVIGLPGKFQIQNAAVALASACVLERFFGFPLSVSRTKRALRNAFWPGRFERVTTKGQTVVLDGAHNGASARALFDSVKTFFGSHPIVTILGTSREKDLRRILEPILPQTHFLIATKSANPRAQETRTILEAAHQMGFDKPTFWAADIRGALRIARTLNRVHGGKRRKRSGAVWVVTGSLFLVGEARKVLGCRTSI